MQSNDIQDTAKEFRENKFIVVRGFISPEITQLAHQYLMMKAEIGDVLLNEEMVPNTPSIYADTLTETLMMMVTPRVEKLIGKSLFPTFSSMRVYKTGDVLLPHTDRPSGEIGLTLNLGFNIDNLEDKNYRWKIYVDPSKDYRHHPEKATMNTDSSEGIGVELEPGDCIIYHGCEVKHWRNAFKGVSHTQTFFMFVDQNGPYKKFKFDTRPSLGLDADTMADKGPWPYFPVKKEKRKLNFKF